MTEYSEIIGSIAATLTTLCFVPQVIKVVKEKNTSSISLSMYVAFSAGVFLWLIYGIMIDKAPIIIANIVTLTFSLIIVFMKIKHK